MLHACHAQATHRASRAPTGPARDAMEEVEIATSMGSFTVELYPKQAPKTCKNFVEL